MTWRAGEDVSIVVMAAEFTLAMLLVLHMVAGCSTANASQEPTTAMPVVNYCALPWARCPGCAAVDCGDAVEQWWCCDPDGECWPVDYATDCNPGMGGWLAYCEFGQSTEQTTLDGEGWECLG